MEEQEVIFKICEIKTKNNMYPINSANSQIKKAIALALEFGKRQAEKEIFDIFDKYACIKNDKWYLELKKRHLENQITRRRR